MGTWWIMLLGRSWGEKKKRQTVRQGRELLQIFFKQNLMGTAVTVIFSFKSNQDTVSQSFGFILSQSCFFLNVKIMI